MTNISGEVLQLGLCLCWYPSQWRRIAVCLFLWVLFFFFASLPAYLCDDFPLQPRLLTHGSFTPSRFIKVCGAKLHKPKGPTLLYFAYFGTLLCLLLFISFTCEIYKYVKLAVSNCKEH